ncbi:hypothetical protein [Sessilibacter sp. MAH4]
MQLGSVKVTAFHFNLAGAENLIAVTSAEGNQKLQPELLKPYLTEQEFELYLAGYIQAFNDRNKERFVFPSQILDGSAARLLRCNWNDVKNVVAIGAQG